MTYSNSVSELPPYTPFDATVEQSTESIVKVQAGRIIGDNQSPLVTWTCQISDDLFILDNGLDIPSVFNIPQGSTEPTVQFDMNNNPTIAYNVSGTINCQSMGLQILERGETRSVAPADIIEISIVGRQPKLVKSSDAITSVIQLFCICPIDGSDYLCCFDIGKTESLVLCIPSTIPYLARSVKLPDTITANTVYLGPSWTFAEASVGEPYLAGNGDQGMYASMVFQNLGDFNFTFEKPSPQISYDGSKYVFIFSETGVDHSQFLEDGSHQPNSIYFITDVTTNAVEVINTMGGTSYSGMQWNPLNFIDYNNQTLSYQFESGFFSSSIPVPTNPYAWTVLSYSQPLQTVFAPITCGLFDSTTGPFIQQGDEISYSVNNGPSQTFTAPVTDVGIFVIQQLFSQVFADFDQDYNYYQNVEDPPLFTDGFIYGNDVEGNLQALKQPITVNLFLSTASPSFQVVLKSVDDIEFHTCGGVPFDVGPGPGV